MRSTLRSLHSVVPLLGLAVVGACADVEDPVAPAPPVDEPAFAIVQPPVVTYMRPVTIQRTAETRQIVPIQLDTLPRSRFTDPFVLHVTKEGANVLGSISMDSVTALRLVNLAPGDTAKRGVRVGSQSVVVVVLSGGPGSVTLWITGTIDPAPTIDIRTPARAAMLMSASMDSSNVIIRGEACHPHVPITSLIVDGVDFAVDGDQLCEPFAVARRSGWGVNMFLVVARAANGRERRILQSFLRSPTWYPIPTADAPSFVPVGAAGALDPILAMGGDATPSNLSQVLRARIATSSLLPHLPAVILDREPAQPRCIIGRTQTRRGYKVMTRAVTDDGRRGGYSAFGTRAGSSITVDTPQAILTVHSFEKTSCQPTLTDSASATVHASSHSVGQSYDLHIVDGALSVSPASRGQSFGNFTAALGRLSYISSAQRDSILAALPGALHAALQSWGAELAESHEAVLVDGLEDYAPSIGADGAALGVGRTARLDSIYPDVGGSWLEWSLSFAPLEQRAGAAPARGPIRRGTSHIAPVGNPWVAVIADDAVNALFWSSWQAGAFDIGNLMTYQPDSPVPGLRAEIRSLLPPVLSPGRSAGHVRIELADVRLMLRIDPSVFGRMPRGTPAVRVATHANVVLEGPIVFDDETGAPALQLTQSLIVLHPINVDWPILDLSAVATHLRSRLAGFVNGQVARTLAALPLPAATLGPPAIPQDLSLSVVDASTQRGTADTRFYGDFGPN